MTIGFQKTPGRPVEITFGPALGTPSDQQELLLLGHAASGTTGINTVVSINNVSDVTAVTTEANAKFGTGSELANMIIAAVKSNAAAGRSNFPPIKAVPLQAGTTDFGTTDAALTAVKQVKAEFVVSPYDAQTDASNLTKLKAACAEMSSAQRVENNQFGTIGVAANQNVVDPSSLVTPDTEFLSLIWGRNSSPAISNGELAAAYAALLAGNISPFNPVDGIVLGGIATPAALSDYIQVGGGLESEVSLAKGWTPLKSKVNGEVAVVRSTTTRITIDGNVAATAYYDVQDFQTLYFWRKTAYTRLSQPDFANVKASDETAKRVLGEMIRLAKIFETNTMFQAVDQLAKQFSVDRSLSDRHRFDIYTPVNVVPGLHVLATTVQASTQFDVLTV